MLKKISSTFLYLKWLVLDNRPIATAASHIAYCAQLYQKTNQNRNCSGARGPKFGECCSK